jgi:hypothetical protein
MARDFDAPACNFSIRGPRPVHRSFIVGQARVAVRDAEIVGVVESIGYASTATLSNSFQFTWLLILFVTAAVCGGEWLGNSVLESGKPMDIKLKGSTMSGVKLIIVMSGHTIFLKDQDLYIAATEDITQFHSVGISGSL